MFDSDIDISKKYIIVEGILFYEGIFFDIYFMGDFKEEWKIGNFFNR